MMARRMEKGYENKTNLYFDKEALDNVIGDIYNEYASYFQLERFNGNYFKSIVDKQNEIRDKLDEAFLRGILKSNNIKQKKLKKPDYFALFMCFTFYDVFDKMYCWEDVIQQLSIGISGFQALDDEDVYKCCCSHKIKDKYAYINLDAERFLIVGCVCINKNLLEYTENGMRSKVKTAKKEMILIKKEQKKRREKRIMDENIKDYIYKYSHNGLEYLINKMRRDNIQVPCFIKTIK